MGDLIWQGADLLLNGSPGVVTDVTTSGASILDIGDVRERYLDCDGDVDRHLADVWWEMKDGRWKKFAALIPSDSAKAARAEVEGHGEEERERERGDEELLRHRDTAGNQANLIDVK